LRFLLTEGRAIRDALTHPSPYGNRSTNDPSKTERLLTTNANQLKQLFESAMIYVKRTEESLGHDPSKSVPWLRVEGLGLP